MNKVRNLFSGMLAVLAVLLLTGCGEKDNPVRTSLDVDTSTLTLSVGESAVRMASSKAEDAAITYTSSCRHHLHQQQTRCGNGGSVW